MKQEWLKKLPQFARRFEMSLYQSAPSLEAYLDRTTLNTRLTLLANDNGKRSNQQAKKDEDVKVRDPRKERKQAKPSHGQQPPKDAYGSDGHKQQDKLTLEALASFLESDSDIETESDIESDSDEEDSVGSDGHGQQKKKFILTSEQKVVLREAVLSAIRHPQGTVDSELLQRAIAEGLPEKAVLNAAVVARQRGANYTNAEALMTEFCNISYMTDLPLPFLDDLGRICRAIHLRRYGHKDTQAIQLDVQNSLSNCIGEDPRLNSIARHQKDFFNSLWQEYMVPSDVPPLTSPLYSAFQKRAKARTERLSQLSSTVLSSQVMLKVNTALSQFIEMRGKADKLDENTVLDLGDVTGETVKFIRLLRHLIASIGQRIEDDREEYTALNLYVDVMNCCSNVFEHDKLKKAKIKQRLDRILGKVFASIDEANGRGVNQSSIWGCCAAIIWARESEGEEEPYWPAIVIGM